MCQLPQLALQPPLRLGDRSALGVLRHFAQPLQLSGFCRACRLRSLCGLVLSRILELVCSPGVKSRFARYPHQMALSMYRVPQTHSPSQVSQSEFVLQGKHACTIMPKPCEGRCCLHLDQLKGGADARYCLLV